MLKKKDLKLSVDELLEKYPVKNLISDLLEIANTKSDAIVVEQPKIAVTDVELQQIVDMFRIKQTGTGRGRKPKSSK